VLTAVCNGATITNVDVSHAWVHEEPVELLDFMKAPHCLEDARIPVSLVFW
jgi:hypothetical protein